MPALAAIEDSINGRSLQLNILSTPLFAAAFADDQDRYLQKLLGQVFIKCPSHLSFEITVTVAIVDRIPVPSNVSVHTDHGYEESVANSQIVAAEGVAYFMRTSRRTRLLQGLNHGQAFVRFSRANESNSREKVTIEVPLANTTFAAGEDCVLVKSLWLKRAVGKQLPVFTRMARRKLKSATISEQICPATRPGITTSITATLSALTLPRKVEAGMGNVISRIAGPNHTSPSSAASSEVLAALSSSVANTSAEATKISVWALVIPEALYSAATTEVAALHPPTDLTQPPSQLSTTQLSVLASLLHSGTRMHRVLSGGGEWGHKAKLIALDPETSFEVAERPSNDNLFHSPMALSFLDSLAEIGSHVQFFLHQPNGNMHTQELASRTANDTDTQIRMEFGTAPSTTDEMPPDPTRLEQSPVSASGTSTYFPRHFGALSERGIVLRVAGTKQLSEKACQTKLAIPSLRLSYFTSPLSWTARRRHVAHTYTRLVHDVQYQICMVSILATRAANCIAKLGVTQSLCQQLSLEILNRRTDISRRHLQASCMDDQPLSASLVESIDRRTAHKVALVGSLSKLITEASLRRPQTLEAGVQQSERQLIRYETRGSLRIRRVRRIPELGHDPAVGLLPERLQSSADQTRARPVPVARQCRKIRRKVSYGKMLAKARERIADMRKLRMQIKPRPMPRITTFPSTPITRRVGSKPSQKFRRVRARLVRFDRVAGRVVRRYASGAEVKAPVHGEEMRRRLVDEVSSLLRGFKPLDESVWPGWKSRDEER